MWGVKWLTNGGSGQASDGARTASSAPDRGSNEGGHGTTSARSQEPPAETAGKSSADHVNGHAAGQPVTAEGSRTPAGASFLGSERSTARKHRYVGTLTSCRARTAPCYV